jgi:DNA-binding response OmpR family regulator
MKVLIVEDESIVSFDIQMALESFGYVVTDTVENYDDALKSVQNDEPQLILMDINLEDSKDGIEIAHAVQKTNDIPIVYLTAFCDDKTIDRAVETNPLAYMIKPFNRNELKSTLRLAIHKMNPRASRNNEYTQLGEGYAFDKLNNNLYFDDMPIKLSNKEEMLLRLLIESKNAIVSFSDIEHNVWADKAVADSTLRSLIFRLRSKLNHKFIETVPSFGCKLKKN